MTLPSQVIDITPGQPLRLIITNKSMPAAAYTTLSHCWSSHMPFRLLSSNIARMQKEIAFPFLTKTFQDAIYTSRRLGVKYIWIDSLCIIQDSDQDWQEQSAAMAQVYSYSYCNIAATHARDGTFGCFTTRNPAAIMPLELDLNWGPNLGSYYLVQSIWDWECNVFKSAAAPLNMRAWAFQERTLAPRNLLFGATEVSFECRESRASEHYPSQVPSHVDTEGVRGIRPHIDGPRIRKSLGLGADPSLDAFTVWGDLVEEYSRRHLTYVTDRLVALSAISSEMHVHTQSEFLAGLWRQHLPYQLLWDVQREQWLEQPRRSIEYIAPSWSWASVIGGQVKAACEVRFADDREIVLKIVEARVKLVSAANPFGQVKSGFLRVKGCLAMALVVIRTSNPGSEGLRLSINHEAVSTVIWDDEEEIATAIGQEFHLLPIQYVPHWEEVIRNSVSMGVPPVSGIVLRQTCPVEREYSRVGKFEDFGDPIEFQSACRQFAALAGDEEQEIEGWGPRHLLTIL